MSLTLVALFILLLCLKFVLDPKGTYKLLKHSVHKEEGVMLSGVAALAFAMLIFMETGFELDFEWEYLLAWIGLIAALKGVVRLFFPGWTVKWVKRIKAQQLPVWGFLGLLFALFLVYVDTQILT